MATVRETLLFLCYLISLMQLFAPTLSKSDNVTDCIEEMGFYNTTKSLAYLTNLNYVLSNLSSVPAPTGFYNFSYGTNQDTAYAIALCRGDVTKQICQDCISTGRKALPEHCPGYFEAITAYDDCMLRYATRPIVGTMEVNPYFYWYGLTNVSESALSAFGEARTSLLRNLSSAAAAGSGLKYKSGSAPASNGVTIYALVQCTPDISEKDCSDCMDAASGHIPKCCGNRFGGRVILPSCNLRWEKDQFYSTPTSTDGTATTDVLLGPTANNTTLPPTGNNDAIAIAVPVVVGSFIIVICLGVVLRMRKKSGRYDSLGYNPNAETIQFSLATIKDATDNFSVANELGKGGFGTVYKGKLGNEQEIAVKRLGKECGQGETEFKNEIELLIKLQHRNLVRLLGYCLEGEERLLIYEFMHNSSLDKALFGPNKHPYMNWEGRFRIIQGIARGLLYLHEDSRLKIIHRDMKAGNILLDLKMNPKIADFGLARLFPQDQTVEGTKKLVGTYGYMAPEYINHGKLSVKSDVFSFGVILLEIVRGEKNSTFNKDDKLGIRQHALEKWTEGRVVDLIDPALKDGLSIEISQMITCIHIALLCVLEKDSVRPTMGRVVHWLNEKSAADLPDPLKSETFQPDNQISSVNEITISDVYPR